MARVHLDWAIAASVVAVAAHSAGAGELRGRFLVDGRPAAGVTVAAVACETPFDEARREARRLPAPPPLATATAGPDGTYALRVVKTPGNAAPFDVRVEGAGVVAAAVAGPWVASESVELGDHVLLAGGPLMGRVCGPTGAGVAGAEVVLLAPVGPAGDPDLDPAPARTRTAADGSFRLDGARPAGNVLTVGKDGFLAVRLTGVRAGALPAPVVLGAGVPLLGSVRSIGGTSPAAGALVRVEARVATRWVETAADGTFVIPNAPAGAVTAVADGGEGGYVEMGGVQLPQPKGKALALVLKPASAVVGRTVDAKTGRAVPRVRVQLRCGTATRAVRSGADGTYAVRTLPPKLWQVRADEPRYVRWVRAGVAVSAGESNHLDIPLVLGASLTGRVTDEAGQPVANAQGVLAQSGPINLLRVVRRLGGAEPPVFRTRADGTFNATRLAPGTGQLLTVTHPDFVQATVGGLSLLPGATQAGVAVVLRSGSAVTGTVKDGQGHPIAGADVALARPFVFAGGRPGGRGGGAPPAALQAATGTDPKADTTATDGTFALRGVAPGEYVLTVKRSGFATERIDPVKVAKTGPPPPITVTLTPGAAISGRVVRGSGAGAEGFVIVATAPGTPRFGGGVRSDQPTGSDGGFSLGGLKPGQSYDLQLLGPTGIGQGKRGVTAPAASVVLTVAGPGRITGTARDAQDGRPLTDFMVSYQADRGGPLRAAIGAAVGAGTATAGGPAQPVQVSGGDGTFAIEDVPAGTWSVVVEAKGYQRAHTGGVAVEEGATTAGVEVKAAKGAALKGHVVDALTGAPVANATASIAAGGGAGRPPGMGAAASGDASTDADGNFELAGVAPGKQTLHVTQTDYTDASQTVDVNGDDTTVEVRMTQGGVLAGSVASDAGGPVPGATVTLAEAGGGGFGFGAGAGAQQTMSDGAGQFRFDHLGAGRYSLTATLGSTTSAPAEAVLQAGQSQQGVTLQLQTGVTLQGTVSGLPATMVNGMTVTAAGADSYAGSMRVGGDGGFEFDNVPVGVVTLRGTATDPSGSTRSATKQVTATADQPVLPVELVFDPGYALSGRVTQAGQPVAGANVFAGLLGGGGRQASAVTDDGGSYQLTGLQQGTYTVGAAAAAGSSQRQTVTLTSDQTLDIEFPSAKIAGQVVDADGNLPLANATVTATPQDPNAAPGARQRPVTTDSNGQFSFAGLDEGPYTLATSLADYQLDTRDVTASDQGADGLVVALKRGAGIGIRVVDGIAGVPLPGVIVRVFGPGMAPLFGPAPVALDGDGVGEIPSLPQGTYTVIAAASGYAPVRLDGVNVPSPAVTIALTPGGTVVVRAGPKTLAAGTATGTVATAGGQPALLSVVNLQGNIAVSEPSVQLRNVPPGSYVLTLPAVGVSQAFTVLEGNATVVALP